MDAIPALWEEHAGLADVLGTEPFCVTAYPSAPDLYDVQRLIAHYREYCVVLLFYNTALTKAIDAGRIYTVQN